MKQLLGKAHDPNFWQEVRNSEVYRPLREMLMQGWEADGAGEIPQLNYSAYRRFVYDGDRDTYERPYFTRRRALSAAAVLTLIYPEEEKYMVKLMDLIYAVCDEYTWCLPAHQTELGVNNNRHIDLFAAETGFCLAEIYTLLGDRMEPLIADRIRVEINRRIIESFMETNFFWEKVGMNWAAVCTGSVSCTFMLMRPDLAEQLEERFCSAMKYFLGGFDADGICTEGFVYWCYGFGFFTVWADMIRTFTDGRVDFFKHDKAMALAPFLGRMYLSGGSVVSFADSGRTGRYNIGILHYLKHEYPETVTIPDPAYAESMDAGGRWCTFLRSFIWLDPDYMQKAHTTTDMTHYAPSAQWLIKRTQAYGFAAKGGHNSEHHNHHDVGSFILAKDGYQIFTDPGSGLYTRQYFDGRVRYDSIACGSHGHSVPFFGTSADRENYGKYYGYQKDGKQYRAVDVMFEGDSLSMDIAPAYAETFVHHVIRRFDLHDNGFTLRDVFDVDAGIPVTDRLVSLYPFQIEEGRAVTDKATITYDSTRYEVSTSVGEFRPETPVYFLDFLLKDGVCEFEANISVD